MRASKRVYALVGMGVAVILVAGIVAYTALAQDSPAAGDTGRAAADFRILSRAHTDVCAYLGNQQANTNYIDSLDDSYYLQGACCNPMVYSHYTEQITGLKNYSQISIIPHDPYNASASLAKQMISFDSISLTPAQQAVYGSALKSSSEGPCCCQCWAWYAHEGVAKELISKYNWGAQQISNIWKLEDCCGGA